MALDGKYFQALLNGLGKRLFRDEESITDVYLVEVIFRPSGVHAKAAKGLIRALEGLLRQAQKESWAPQRVKQAASTVSGISADNADQLATFWRQEAPTARAAAMQETRMCSPATVSGWRVDVATQAKTVAEMNDPLAVFELTIGDKVTGPQPPLRFELSQSEMEHMTATLDQVHNALQSLSRAA